MAHGAFAPAGYFTGEHTLVSRVLEGPELPLAWAFRGLDA